MADNLISAADILKEVHRQTAGNSQKEPSSVIEKVAKELKDSSVDDETVVDIITYINSEWGLNENPYPIQQFILKMIFGLPLDDKPTDEIVKVLSPKVYQVVNAAKFTNESVVDLGKNTYQKISHVDTARNRITFANDLVDVKEGDGIFARILVWDRFRETVLHTFNETEFLTYLYEEGPKTGNCICNISPEMHNKRLGQQMTMVIIKIS